MIFYAHRIIDENGKERRQTVAEHCRKCAEYAASTAPTWLSHAAYLAGLLHDMGKYTVQFQEYLDASINGEVVRRGSVNHSFAAIRFIWETWHKSDDISVANFTAELLAFAAGSHHGQFDCITPEGKDGFFHRINTDSYNFHEARTNYFSACAELSELQELFSAALKEVTEALDRLHSFIISDVEDESFYCGLFARLLLSAVIDGDRRDTAEFMYGEEFDKRFNMRCPAWDEYLSHFEEKLSVMTEKSSLDSARRNISLLCKEAAGMSDGIYRLDVPTGGGKTLASLRYALAKASKGKKRIFFVIPLLSVLDQNVKVIREYLKDDHILLEHHSNVVRDNPFCEEPNENEFLMDTWQAYFVVTTLVQLFNTLFSDRTSCIRRMAALCSSVLIIDEVQSVPRNMLSLFNLAMNFLSFCGATVVLCSATQPALDNAAHPIVYASQADIVPYNAQMWQHFRRTNIQVISEPMDIESLAAFTVSQVEAHRSVLLICNTKAEAKEIYYTVKSCWPGNLFHLSTSMCMYHRRLVMDEISTDLQLGEKPVICISTQLVEAGVDLSFGCVIRLLAGLDNVVQAAGRCNRNKESEMIKPVYIVELKNEKLYHLDDINLAQLGMRSLIFWMNKQPEDCRDFTSKEAIRIYYQSVYRQMKAGGQDYPLKNTNESLLRLLAHNPSGWEKRSVGNTCFLGQAFKTAGDSFKVFENDTVDVIVPFHSSGADLLTELGSDKTAYNFGLRSDLLRKAAAYSVSLYDHELKRLEEVGGVYPVNTAAFGNAVLALMPDFYSAETGFNIEGNINMFLEV